MFFRVFKPTNDVSLWSRSTLATLSICALFRPSCSKVRATTSVRLVRPIEEAYAPTNRSLTEKLDLCSHSRKSGSTSTPLVEEDLLKLILFVELPLLRFCISLSRSISMILNRLDCLFNSELPLLRVDVETRDGAHTDSSDPACRIIPELSLFLKES